MLRQAAKVLQSLNFLNIGANSRWILGFGRCCTPLDRVNRTG